MAGPGKRTIRRLMREGELVACPHFTLEGKFCAIARGAVGMPGVTIRRCDGTYQLLDVEKGTGQTVFAPGLWLGYLSHLLNDEDCLMHVARYYNVSKTELWAAISRELDRIKRGEGSEAEEELDEAFLQRFLSELPEPPSPEPSPSSP